MSARFPPHLSGSCQSGSCQQASETVTTSKRREVMSTEPNKAIVLRWREELWTKRNVHIIDELHAPDYVGHYSGIPGPIRGREALKQLFAAYLAAFDIQVTPEFLIA